MEWPIEEGSQEPVRAVNRLLPEIFNTHGVFGMKVGVIFRINGLLN
jgi:hypothetical protein